jgi:hypothetical protein
MPKQKPITIPKFVIPSFRPSFHLVLPLDTENIEDIRPIIIMSGTMSVTCVRLQSVEFFALGLDRLHGGKTEGAEMSVEWVERVALFIFKDGRTEYVLGKVLDKG